MKMFSQNEERILWCALQSYKSNINEELKNTVGITSTKTYNDLKITEELIQRFEP